MKLRRLFTSLAGLLAGFMTLVVLVATPAGAGNPPAPAPVAYEVFRFNRATLEVMARSGVVAYAEGGSTRLSVRPLELALTMPIVRTETGAGVFRTTIGGRMVFRNLRTGASVGLELMHGNVSASLFITTTNVDLPALERVLFWIGGADENGVQEIRLANRALVEGPLTTGVFPADGVVGTLQTIVS